MGDLMPGIPSVPGDETSWANFVDQFETLKRGDMPLSLTNWDDLDLVPSIAAGAGIEIAGATYRFTTESLISDEAGIVAGTVYVVIKTADPTVNEATAYFTNVAPTWRDDLNGWYDTTGANRYTGHVMEWDGADAYTDKRMLPKHDVLMLSHKTIETTFATATTQFIPHGIPDGANRIQSVAVFAYADAQSYWYNIAAAPQDSSNAPILVNFSDSTIGIADLDSDVSGKPGRIFITYTALP